jgi:hypothetical protein
MGNEDISIVKYLRMGEKGLWNLTEMFNAPTTWS